MTRITLGRRISALEQAQPATLPWSLRRWLGDPLTDEQHYLADVEVIASNDFVGPADHRRMDAGMLEWLSMRGIIMRLDARVARLEAAGPSAFLTAEDRDMACTRYADAHDSMIGAFPGAMSPTAYRTAMETTRDPKHQRVFACWMPGDDDL